MLRVLTLSFLIYFLPIEAIGSVTFHFAENDGPLTCNGDQQSESSPFVCEFNEQGLLTINLDSWGEQGRAVLREDSEIIGGSCYESLIAGQPDTYNLIPQCRPGFDPDDPAPLFFLLGDGPLTCNGEVKEKVNNEIPIRCPFDDKGLLIIGLKSWGWEGTAILRENSGENSDSIEIAGFCLNSVERREHTSANLYNVKPECIVGNNPPPMATGKILVEEWFTDIPWHQKLSTLHSNLIDTPFVLPVEALKLNDSQLTYCGGNNKDDPNLDVARCMLRYGIVNIIAMNRTDTLYKVGEALTTDDCQGTNGTDETDCVEVKIDVHRYHTNTTKEVNAKGVAYEADPIRNNTFDKFVNGQKIYVPGLGFGINEATLFAPWRPWFTGHYCAYFSDAIQDAVCYDDYFTTQLIAATPVGTNWIKDYPALFWPRSGRSGSLFEKYCQSVEEGNTENTCTMYLGKVAWDRSEPKNPESKVVACDIPAPPAALDVCKEQVEKDTANLDTSFNSAIKEFDDQGRYAWNESAIDFKAELKKEINFMSTNPFIGFYELERSERDKQNVFRFQSPHYALPKKCTQTNYWKARQGNLAAIRQLEDCALNFEIHTTGFYEQWEELYGGSLSDSNILQMTNVLKGLNNNQYGRTMFIYAGVPEQHVAVDHRLYDQIYNASLYIQYLPMVNPADRTLTNPFPGKNYGDDFWHAFFMSNHMNQEPGHFIRGIRGRTLWHNEYRSNLMYKAVAEDKEIKGTPFEKALKHVDFPAGFQVDSADELAPFHGNTCDSCHIRNGSGVPLMPNGNLPKIHSTNHKMRSEGYSIKRDYTYTNPELPAMKMVFFDLKDPSGMLEDCDDNNHTVPKSETESSESSDSEVSYYKNKIMNFFGNSFHVNQKNNLPTYQMVYEPISSDNDADDYEIVDQTDRGSYQPKKVVIKGIETGAVCQDIADKPPQVDVNDWPENCTQVSGKHILDAIYGNEEEGITPEIGFMRLLGRRLGNTPMIEMIPDESIFEARRLQAVEDGPSFPGCISLAPGTRSGEGGKFNYRNCSSEKWGKATNDCYIGRWGWIGDRASLEDQIANAAHVEMNITSKESYQQVNPDANVKQLVRYKKTLCGPADASCQSLPANSDIFEQEIRDMATYQRWIGIPNRSEYQVSSEKVQKGEQVFKDLQCDSCHVIKKIVFDYDDNMLPDEERKLLKNLQSSEVPDYPFISYLGTDLLMHDMGYLSQIAKAPKGEKIRNKENGTVKEEYKAYIQKIRTPALKGLKFNRFVTDSNHNTQNAPDTLKQNFTPGCDFLLHDGRACDAIEAAFLHDGPAIKDLGVIETLIEYKKAEESGDPEKGEKLKQLRAFLYSL